MIQKFHYCYILFDEGKLWTFIDCQHTRRIYYGPNRGSAIVWWWGGDADKLWRLNLKEYAIFNNYKYVYFLKFKYF